MSIHLKSNGSWVDMRDPNIKVNGVNTPIKEGWIKDAGVWKRGYQRVVELMQTGNEYNVNLYNKVVATGQADFTKPVQVQYTINAGVWVSGSDRDQWALNLRGFPAGSVISVINNGYITGAPGAGGVGGSYTGNAGAGGYGGHALLTQNGGYTQNVTNNGLIASGGGGGGGGGGGRSVSENYNNAYNGGGGGSRQLMNRWTANAGGGGGGGGIGGINTAVGAVGGAQENRYLEGFFKPNVNQPGYAEDRTGSNDSMAVNVTGGSGQSGGQGAQCGYSENGSWVVYVIAGNGGAGGTWGAAGAAGGNATCYAWSYGGTYSRDGYTYPTAGNNGGSPGYSHSYGVNWLKVGDVRGPQYPG